MYLSKFFENFK